MEFLWKEILSLMGAYLAVVLVQIMYSISWVQGFENANADVLSQTQSRFLARNRYTADITCPLSFNTVEKFVG